WRGRGVLTEHEIVDLGDEANLRMFEVREELRHLSRLVRESANGLPKATAADGTPRPLAEHVRLDPEFGKAWEAAFRKMIAAAGQRTDPQWGWLDPETFLEVCCLVVHRDGNAELLRPLRRDGDGVRELSYPREPVADEAAALEIKARVREAFAAKR